MLSEWERRELALIEQSLVEDDRRLAESFQPGELRVGTPWSRRRWVSRALFGFGVALLVIGLLTAADGLFMQGVLFGGAAIVWMRWQTRTAPTPPPGARQRRSPDGTRP